MDTSPSLRTGRIIVAALALGMLTFTGVAAALAGQTGRPPDPDMARLLLWVLGILAVGETGAYFALVRPSLIRQTKRQVDSMEDPDRDAVIEQRYLNMTILGAALAEGLGLFGAVIVLITGRMEAIAAPAGAAVALALIFPTPDRLARFREAVAGHGFPT